jgi:hypothetical protein
MEDEKLHRDHERAPSPIEIEIELDDEGGQGRSMLGTGLFRTANGVMSEKLLREHEEALQAYLCIRLGDPRLAAAAYDDVGLFLESRTRKDLEAGPSLRALICRVARDVSSSQVDPDAFTDGDRDQVPWEPAPLGSIEGYGAALDHVRRSLRTIEAELLALRHTHGLELEELAYVFGEDRAMLERRFETAMAWVDLLVGEALPGRRLDSVQVVRDAFRIIPSSVVCFSERRRGPPPKLAPGVRVGERYEIVGCIGGGRFAWVYRANDVQVPGHQVALKMLHRPARTPITREGAMRELGLIASAFHPSLVQFKDHGWFLDRLWFVMPWYEGETLRARIERAPLRLDEAAPLFVQLARALSALHGAGIIHQDIKPENIFLAHLKGDRGAPTGEVLPVILDLGVAAPEGELALAGTPVYFSPEAAERLLSSAPELPLTPKADVFALALSLVHSLLGAPEDARKSAEELERFLTARAKGGEKAPRHVKLRLVRALLERALARDPSARPSAAELADGLAALARPRRRRAPLAGLGAAAALTLTATFAALALHPEGAASVARLHVPTAAPRAFTERARLELLERRLHRQEDRAERLERELEAHRERAASAGAGAPGAETASLAR